MIIISEYYRDMKKMLLGGAEKMILILLMGLEENIRGRISQRKWYVIWVMMCSRCCCCVNNWSPNLPACNNHFFVLTFSLRQDFGQDMVEIMTVSVPSCLEFGLRRLKGLVA